MHRNFDLASKIAKNKPLTYRQAESFSNFCNQIITVKQSTAADFITPENDAADQAIDNYLELKEFLKVVKIEYGTNRKNELYKVVKKFYRKKMFCYQMDCYYCNLICGLKQYQYESITFSEFMRYYCFEVSLFDGRKHPIDLRNAIKISRYILNLQSEFV